VGLVCVLDHAYPLPPFPFVLGALLSRAWWQGAVYHNRMINVGVLNNKLYFRSLDLVKMFSGADDSLGACPGVPFGGTVRHGVRHSGAGCSSAAPMCLPDSLLVPGVLLLFWPVFWWELSRFFF
jgi:hypothetical protein